MFAPISVCLSEYLYKLYHFYYSKTLKLYQFNLVYYEIHECFI